MSKLVPYNYVEHKDTGEAAFKISEGKFMGLVWNYQKVKLPVIDNEGNPIDLEEANQLPLTFEYEVLYNPTTEDLTSGELGEVLGDILMDVIQEGLNHDGVEFNYENRDNDTNESNI